MAQDILTRLNGVKVINGTTVRTFLNISNSNFANITSALKDFLSDINFDETSNSISVKYLNTENINLSKKLDFIVNGENVFSIDALGRVRGKYVTISDIVETKRLRLLRYPNYPDVGIDGEVIYSGSDFYGYIDTIGWVSLTSGEGGGGGAGVGYFRGLVNGIASTNIGIDTSDNDGRHLIDWRVTATDDFAGHEGEIAIYESGWEFTAPGIGFAVAVRNESNSIYVCQEESPITWIISGYFYEEIVGGVHYVKHMHPTGETAIVSSVII